MSVSVWWLAIDKNNKHCSYKELKVREVVAQGWPAFGDLSKKIVFRYPLTRSDIQTEIQRIGDQAYKGHDFWVNSDRNLWRAPRIFWNLLNLSAEDIIVGIEGTHVRGICELPKAGIDGYTYNPAHNYAHGFGGSVQWVDWSQSVFGIQLSAPRRSVHGLARLSSQARSVEAAWKKYMAFKKPLTKGSPPLRGSAHR